MATSFSSRLSGLRPKKQSTHQEQQGQFKLTLPQNNQKSSYEPTSTFNNTRTSMRLLKGRIERGQSSEKTDSISNNLNSNNKLSLNDEPTSGLRLVINDDPIFDEKKTAVQPPKIPNQKRILIAKEPPKEQPKKEEVRRQEPKRQQEQKRQEEPKRQEPKRQELPVNSHQEKPIHEEEVEESNAENQNDLVLCPEGCGRKFNRKALEKHAKACKIVFMSKRKEFNSQAKRITSKEQATIVKQSKIKEKKEMGMTKGKGFGQTGDNWKAASEDFRSAIKAIKKEEGAQEGAEKSEEPVVVVCEFCEKQFNEVFIDKHLQNCVKKKEKEQQKKKPTKK